MAALDFRLITSSPAWRSESEFCLSKNLNFSQEVSHFSGDLRSLEVVDCDLDTPGTIEITRPQPQVLPETTSSEDVSDGKRPAQVSPGQ